MYRLAAALLARLITRTKKLLSQSLLGQEQHSPAVPPGLMQYLHPLIAYYHMLDLVTKYPLRLAYCFIRLALQSPFLQASYTASHQLRLSVIRPS